MNENAIFRILALAERLMDEGRLKWVMAPSPINGNLERMPVTDHVMAELGLVHNQTINSILVEAIADAHEREMNAKFQGLSEKINELIEDSQMKEDFDFRSMMNEGDNSTKH